MLARAKAAVKAVIVAAVASCAVSVSALAQPYPSNTVTIVVPFLAGGAVDTMARIIAQKLQDYWKQPVVVENHPGGGGGPGSNLVAQSLADGYKLLLTPHGTVSYNAILYKNLPYDPVKAFTPVTLIGESPNFLIVPNQSPYNSLSDLIAAARKQPGKITYASQGIGTTPHLTGLRLAYEAKIDITHVPYRGFPPALADLLGNRVTFMFADIGNTMPLYAAKSVKLLAFTGEKRWKSFADVPTMIEQGYPHFVSAVWYALMAPAGTPKPVIDKIRQGVLRAVKDPALANQPLLQDLDLTVTTPEDSRTILANETKKWGELIRALGISID